MQPRVVSAGVVAFALSVFSAWAGGTVMAEEAKPLRWATSSVGTSAYRALVSLSTLLNRKFDGYDITVLPTAGNAASLRGFAAGQFDGYTAADIAFHEIAHDTGRYKGFKAQRPLVQSFWAFTYEVGLGVRKEEADKYSCWSDLRGRPVYTSPAPWDTRAALEGAMNAVGVGHKYVEIDKGLAGSFLNEGTIDGMIIYTAGRRGPAPWIAEAMLAADIGILNPCDKEIAKLNAAGIDVVDVDAHVFNGDVGVGTAKFVPLYVGFHLGLDIPEEDVYAMLNTIKDNAAALAASDPSFSQTAADMVGLQRRAIMATGETVAIHPGLARFLRENNGWDDAWNDRIAR
ncbi:MAG: TAXI family TRAP transporter solute-binding subunit [Hyphomicrobiales bacterium]